MNNSIGVLRSKAGSGEYWACSHYALKKKNTGGNAIIIRHHKHDGKYDPATETVKLEALNEVGPAIKDLSQAGCHEMSNIAIEWEQMSAESVKAITQKNPEHLHIFTRGTSSEVSKETLERSIAQFAHTYVTVNTDVFRSVERAETLLDLISSNEREKCSLFLWFRLDLGTERLPHYEIFDYEQWKLFLLGRKTVRLESSNREEDEHSLIETEILHDFESLDYEQRRAILLGRATMVPSLLD